LRFAFLLLFRTAKHIKNDMSSRKYNLPSLSPLVAFEAAARLQGFARAAEELNTSQPAVSRHIRNLEIRYGTELFYRDKSPICLTPKGSQFYTSVVQSLEALQTAVQSLRQIEERVTIVCSHSVSHLLLMPLYATLRQKMGRDVELRIMTVEYNLLQAAVETGADIVFQYSAEPPERKHVVVCDEEIKPVGSAEIVEQAQRALEGRCDPPMLLKLQKENYGWMDWDDWSSAHPEYSGWQVSEEFDSYVYLLQAAVSGQGLGLGWRRFVDDYLNRGDLIELPVSWHSKNTKLFARLTRYGAQNALAEKCLALLENLHRK